MLIEAHPGRYAAMAGPVPTGPEDPLALALERTLEPFAAALRGYRLSPEAGIQGIRMLRSLLHGIASLEASNGFQMSTDVDQSFTWMIGFLDAGSRTMDRRQ